jgi:hypothetical protein
MNEIDLNQLRKKMAETATPYKIVRRDAIKYVGCLDDKPDISPTGQNLGKNLYRIGETDILVNDYISTRLDELIGIKPRQLKIVRNASGEKGVCEFRNFLATASSMLKPAKIVLIADPTSPTISGITPISKEVIPAEAFLDFVEMFCDHNGLYPSNVQCGLDLSLGIVIYMDSRTPQVVSIAKNEDFLVNSYYLKWNLGTIELGRYYERLICQNGQTELVQEKGSVIHSLQKEDIIKFLDIPQDTHLLKTSFDKFTNKALEAMEVKASIAELKYVFQKLKNNYVDDESIKSIAPFTQQAEHYSGAGYSLDSKTMRRMKSKMTVWELYNNITDFASNNTIWSEDDNRRGMLQSDAISFLMRERDIHDYINLFE